MVYYCLRICKSGCLAQLGEHRLYTAEVGGSSPSASTKNYATTITKWRGSEEAKRG